ncbi:MAG TPA: alkaline phosphatase family protein [Steroidobacteraceae bacterium]|nr:alkaline phosphatase family protein [Steroidobacteraceae bacterium]
MPDIQHIVVLMLENRSFDCLLGRLYPNDPTYAGLTLNESNKFGTTGMSYGVWTDCKMSSAIACTPDPDPGELFVDMNEQICGYADRTGRLPTMSGFVLNYGNQPPNAGWRDPGAVMHYFTPEQVPALTTLARAFGVCDDWHASVPCQTWPNRFFAHTGTSLGYVNNHDFPIPFPAPSIFRKLEDSGVSWRVYFHDMPQSILLGDVWTCALLRFRSFSQFLADAHTGGLPGYSFIEPQYFTDLFGNLIPNDEHPPHDVRRGDALIAQVYNALRSSPCWKRTLLVITYDEHGGCFDHVSPPKAVSPDRCVAAKYNFRFDAYGVRVPAVLVSPYVPPGSRIRAPRTPAGGGAPFDHTSIIRTVRDVFGIPGALTARDASAPSVMTALSLAAPNNDGPAEIAVNPVPVDTQQLTDRAGALPNSMQAGLAAAATHLPLAPPVRAAEVPLPAPQNSVTYGSVARAQVAVTARTKQFLGLA